MEARVKADGRWPSVTACSGREYVKTEWRVVPAGMEAEAERNPFLEVIIPATSWVEIVTEAPPVDEQLEIPPIDEVITPPAVESFTDMAPVEVSKPKRKGQTP